MNMRAPAIPLFNIDPYFSVWSATDKLTDSVPMHWTGKPNTMLGTVTVDGEISRFMGEGDMPAICQKSIDIDALSTYYVFQNEKIRLEITFTSPRIPADLYRLSSPTAYMKARAVSVDGKAHNVRVKLAVSEELCLNEKGQSETETSVISIKGASCIRMGNKTQNPLWRSGDDVRIDWGYFYLAVRGSVPKVSEISEKPKENDGTNYITAEADISEGPALFVTAYDDIYSLVYFGENLKSWWNRGDETIETAVENAVTVYDELFDYCRQFSDKLFCDAVRAGGEKYAELCSLAWRQVMAAHKVAADSNGELLFVSKECFSNGCAATVDVSYPSIPMFLIYNPELIKGMMRPIFRYASTDTWKFDFAPHDAGQYPILNGQVYSNGTDPEWQMPVEECGNMLVMAASLSLAEGNIEFVSQHMDTLGIWADYLAEHGVDPEHQLCTDDFAGHLAHNCNLSIKAIMGIASYAIINDMAGQRETAEKYMNTARSMAETWVKNAANGDGSYRLAFDRPGTFSMKYNAVWDKLFGTDLFPREVIESEVASCFEHFNGYGMPLDNRATYTKADWMVWTATLTSHRDTFIRFVEPLWNAYNSSRSRIPMTDWYDTVTGDVIGFRHRTVMGGLFIKLLEYTGKMTYNRTNAE
ncbi:MAG: DUF4965 domain-containing protein [Eubacteriales bacterium]|jgi:hypothetical protein|nr:DUF4965 domain-containing protein [Eubacteriales bacterium]